LITIRSYTKNDAKELWKIHFYTIRNINIRDYSKKQVEAWAPKSISDEIWNKRMMDLNPFIAEIDGVIVGYTDLQENGFIDHFFCHSEYQGQGVGKALMNHVLSVGKKRDIKRYYSEVSITARPFYEHFGFNVKQEQKFEVRGQLLKNFLMEKYN
jgi:putative acetyltransferase